MLVLELALAIAGVVGSVGILWLMAFPGGRAMRPSFEQETETLVVNLRAAAKTVTQLGDEIALRKDAVAQLREQRKALELTDAQRATLDAMFKREMDRSSRRQFWTSLATSAVFFGLGVLVTALI